MFRILATAVMLVSVSMFGAGQAQAASSKDKQFAHLSSGKIEVLLRMAAEQILIMHPDVKTITPAMIAEEKKIIAALVDALDINGDTAKAFVKEHHRVNKAYYQEIANMFGFPSIVAEETSVESMLSIMLNRQEDLLSLSDMLNAKELEPLVAKYRGGREQRVNDFSISEGGKEKLVVTALQPKQFERGEPAVHIYATAKGQLLEHAILARAFAKGGAIETALATSLQKALPNMDQAKLAEIAAYYIGDRRYFATRVAKSFALDGAVMKDAIARSKVSQRKFDKR